MVNYQLRKLKKYHGKTLCKYYSPLRHDNKGTEIKNIFKSCYHNRHCNNMVRNMQYDDKKAVTIANLVKTTWLTRYPRPMEIMHDQGP